MLLKMMEKIYLEEETVNKYTYKVGNKIIKKTIKSRNGLEYYNISHDITTVDHSLYCSVHYITGRKAMKVNYSANEEINNVQVFVNDKRITIDIVDKSYGKITFDEYYLRDMIDSTVESVNFGTEIIKVYREGDLILTSVIREEQDVLKSKIVYREGKDIHCSYIIDNDGKAIGSFHHENGTIGSVKVSILKKDPVVILV